MATAAMTQMMRLLRRSRPQPWLRLVPWDGIISPEGEISVPLEESRDVLDVNGHIT